MARFPLLVCFGLLTSFYLSIASIDYDNDIQFISEHSNEWVVRIDEGKKKLIIQKTLNIPL